MKFFLKKTITLIITLFIVSLLAFFAFSIIPGDPTAKILGMEASQAQIDALRIELGLDQPVLVRYLDWLGNFVRGDFGTSYSYQLPVRQMLADKLPITALLTLISFLFTLVIAIPLGIYSGSVKSEWLDRVNATIDQVFMSVPQFFIGILMCFVLGISMKWFIPGNYVSYSSSWSGFLSYMIFPAFSIAIPRIAMTVKMLRSSILNELGRDYVRTAHSRGCSRSVILRR